MITLQQLLCPPTIIDHFVTIDREGMILCRFCAGVEWLEWGILWDNQLRNYMSIHWSLHDSLEIYFRAIFHNMVCKSTERWQLAFPGTGYPIRHGLAQFEAHSCCRGALNCRKKCSRDCIVDCACGVAEERKLADKERPLFVQLNWGKDDREGRFLLRNEDHNKNIPVRRQVYCHLSKLSAPSNRI